MIIHRRVKPSWAKWRRKQPNIGIFKKFFTREWVLKSREESRQDGDALGGLFAPLVFWDMDALKSAGRAIIRSPSVAKQSWGAGKHKSKCCSTCYNDLCVSVSWRRNHARTCFLSQLQLSALKCFTARRGGVWVYKPSSAEIHFRKHELDT